MKNRRWRCDAEYKQERMRVVEGVMMGRKISRKLKRKLCNAGYYVWLGDDSSV